MAYRLDGYKIIRAIIVVIYIIFMINQFKKLYVEREENTKEIMKTISIRKSDFINDEKIKNIINQQNEENVVQVDENQQKQNEEQINKNENNEDENIQNEENQNKITQNENELAKNVKKQQNEKDKLTKTGNKNQVKTVKKYIHAATLQTEKAAKEEAKRLGKNFRVNIVKENGKVSYQVVSVVTADAEKFAEIEKQVKRGGSKYFVRTVGK